MYTDTCIAARSLACMYISWICQTTGFQCKCYCFDRFKSRLNICSNYFIHLPFRRGAIMYPVMVRILVKFSPALLHWHLLCCDALHLNARFVEVRLFWLFFKGWNGTIILRYIRICPYHNNFCVWWLKCRNYLVY